MQVSLKVVGGKNDGRLINISVAEFIIGRSEEAHLRPSSDLISRQHCAIKIDAGKVTIEDMGSRNGSFVNEQQLTQPHIARVGDILRVGRLQFEVLIDHVQAGIKKPKVNMVSEAAARTASAKENWNDESITDWLSNSPENQSQSTAMFDTRQFNLDETKYRLDKDEKPPVDQNPVSATPSPSDSVSDTGVVKIDVESGIFGKSKKKSVNKLPPKAKQQAAGATCISVDDLAAAEQVA